MKLNEFIKDMHNSIDKFEREWFFGQASEEDKYPQEMNEEDWFEQFLIWIQTK